MATDRPDEWFTFHVPENSALLEVLGRITVRHGHLDYVLRDIIKTLTGTTERDALDATKREGSANLRERVKKLAKTKLRDGPELIQLQALLERAKRASERRNELIHSLWARRMEGDEAEVMRDEDQNLVPLPTLEALQELELEIKRLQKELGQKHIALLLAALESRVKGAQDKER